MKTKKVELKNIITEVPKNAERIENPEELDRGDYILIIWDNPNWPAGIEKNTRSFGQVHKAITVKGNPKYGFISYQGVHGEASEHNATACSHGNIYLNEEHKNKPFPKVIFRVRKGQISSPKLKSPRPGNTSYDLMC